MKIETLNDLFADELSDMLDAETRIAAAMPKMADAATDKALAESLQEDAEKAKQQAGRIEKLFEMLELERPGEECEAMEGLIEEADEYMEDVKNGRVLDAALITAAQKIKHYEIAGYGSLCALAKTLGYEKEAEILHESLEEEKRGDEMLTELAKGGINEEAARMAA